MANALEQPLLLPHDMANLRSLKKHKEFLTLKRDLAMVSVLFVTKYLHHFILLFLFIFLKAIQVMHIAEELVSNSHKQMKEEEGWHIVVVKAFTLAEQRIKDLNTKLTGAIREKKSTEAALEGAERQAVTQCQ